MQDTQPPLLLDGHLSFGSSKLGNCMDQHLCQVLRMLIGLNCLNDPRLRPPPHPGHGPRALFRSAWGVWPWFEQCCRWACFCPWPLCLLPGLPGWVLGLLQRLLGLELAQDDPWLLECPFSSALYGHNLKSIIIKNISATNVKAKCGLPASLQAPAGEEVGLRKSFQKVSCRRLLKMSAAQR